MKLAEKAVDPRRVARQSQIQLVKARQRIEALQDALRRITWHIGCDKVGRGDLTLTTYTGQRVFFNEGCPACIAKKALESDNGGSNQ